MVESMYCLDWKMALKYLVQRWINLTVWTFLDQFTRRHFQLGGEIWDFLVSRVINMLFNIFITVGVNEVHSIKAKGLG